MVMYAVFPFRSVRVNRWCPSCHKAWPHERQVCPDCLVDLVDDPDATVRCRHCGRDWPATMASCPNCLAELRPDPEVAAEAMGRILAAGGHLPRPAGVAPFAEGPACTLLRLSGRGALAYISNDGLVEASVAGPGGQAVPPLACRDHDGTVLFRLLPYEAARAAVVAIAADGAPLATFLRSDDAIDVRDETSAPVARMVRVRDGFELVETGGATLATMGSTDYDDDGWVDDQWWLQPSARLPLRTLAAVAMVLAAKVLLGRPSPTRVDDRPIAGDDEYEQWPLGN
jgi:hypothetical protein